MARPVKIREEYIGQDISLAQSGTLTERISFTKPITAIDLDFKNTNGATSNTARTISQDITSIAVVDGSHNVFSLPMYEAVAQDYFVSGRAPKHILTEGAAGVQRESVRIHFGRYFGDPDYYLQPNSYGNLQAKIVSAFTESATVGWADDAGAVTMRVHTIESGANAFKGVYRTQSFYDITSVASGDLNIELPVDDPYALLTIIARLTTYGPEEIITNAKMLCDNGGFTPFDTRTLDIMADNIRAMDPFEIQKTILRADDGSSLMPTYYLNKPFPIGTSDDHITTIEAVDADSVQIGFYDLTTPGTPALQTTAANQVLVNSGFAPHGAMYIPFGNFYNGDVLKANDYRDIKLKLTQGTASAQIRAILTQVSSR